MLVSDLCTFGSLMCSYNTFCGYPPEIVKKMPKKDLAEEVIKSSLFFFVFYLLQRQGFTYIYKQTLPLSLFTLGSNHGFLLANANIDFDPL